MTTNTGRIKIKKPTEQELAKEMGQCPTKFPLSPGDVVLIKRKVPDDLNEYELFCDKVAYVRKTITNKFYVICYNLTFILNNKEEIKCICRDGKKLKASEYKIDAVARTSLED